MNVPRALFEIFAIQKTLQSQSDQLDLTARMSDEQSGHSVRADCHRVYDVRAHKLHGVYDFVYRANLYLMKFTVDRIC